MLNGCQRVTPYAATPTREQISQLSKQGVTDYGIVVSELHARCTKNDLCKMLKADARLNATGVCLPANMQRRSKQLLVNELAIRLFNFDNNGNVEGELDLETIDIANTIARR